MKISVGDEVRLVTHEGKDFLLDGIPNGTGIFRPSIFGTVVFFRSVQMGVNGPEVLLRFQSGKFVTVPLQFVQPRSTHLGILWKKPLIQILLLVQRKLDDLVIAVVGCNHDNVVRV